MRLSKSSHERRGNPAGNGAGWRRTAGRLFVTDTAARLAGVAAEVRLLHLRTYFLKDFGSLRRGFLTGTRLQSGVNCQAKGVFKTFEV
ncbi:MAG: hypothetical protein HYR94_27905 [Chloroflexi bacterium]|nr:hypothetical protein [Chloroflexota bacterium]